MRHDFTLAIRGRALGDLLNKFMKRIEFNADAVPDTQPMSLGTLTTGGIGYTYAGRKLDLLGLNNVSMAHSAGDRRGNKNHAAFNRDVFFELMPDLFAAQFSAGDDQIPEQTANMFPFKLSFLAGVIAAFRTGSTIYRRLFACRNNFVCRRCNDKKNNQHVSSQPGYAKKCLPTSNCEPRVTGLRLS